MRIMIFRNKLLILIFSAFFLSGCTIPGLPQKKSGLQVNVMHDERASIFLDGMNAGQSPYKSEELKSGTYTLRIVPEDSSKQAYETTVKLGPGLLTVMNWSFGKTVEESGGEMFELVKLPSKNKTELSIVTNPDNIIVKVDGQSKGFSPLILTDLSEGNHALTLTAPGYVERTSNPKLMNGYRIIVTTKLAREPLATEPAEETPAEETEPSTENSTSTASPTPKPSPTPKVTPKPSASPAASGSASTPDFPYVEISETSTGWLRVRAQASSTAEELAKLDVGTKVPYLDETVSGWHKVEYESGKEGWVSGQYAVIHKE